MPRAEATILAPRTTSLSIFTVTSGLATHFSGSATIAKTPSAQGIMLLNAHHSGDASVRFPILGCAMTSSDDRASREREPLKNKAEDASVRVAMLPDAMLREGRKNEAAGRG